MGSSKIDVDASRQKGFKIVKDFRQKVSSFLVKEGETEPEKRSLFNRCLSFGIEAVKATGRKIARFIVDVTQHTEAVVVLCFASLGASALLAEIPFYMQLPIWVETQMVFPVLSVVIISCLISSGVWRANRRKAKTNVLMAQMRKITQDKTSPAPKTRAGDLSFGNI
jgi:hypothetical protein